MSRKFTVGAVALAFALCAPPAWAQGKPTEGGGGGPAAAGSRPSGGGGGGTAVPRGGSASGGGSAGGSSMGSSSTSSTPASAGSAFTAPSRPPSANYADAQDRRAPSRRGGGERSGGGQRAVPRGSSGGTAAPSGVAGGRARSGSTASAESPDRRAPHAQPAAVPPYSRPRGDRTPTGTAVERGTVRPPYYPGYPVYPIYPGYPWGGWGPGYGWGLGYYYDPFWYGYGAFGWPAYYGGGYYGGGYYGGGGGYYSSSDRDTGNLRLKIKPREAQVFVDGYYVGVVDSFDGTFQRLGIEGGGHRIELKAEGYEPLQFEVLITPGETVTYKGEMKRIQ